MRAVIQRVSEAKVIVGGSEAAKISQGLLVLLAVEASDQESDLKFLRDKILQLRIFEDENGKMNLSVQQVGGEILVVSQFTLYGDCRKGNRPSFSRAAPVERARLLYEQFARELAGGGVRVAMGVFQAMMKVVLVNDGPVTLILDSRKEVF
ncbi:MAG: D-tyrosyl-tRNA(Tyr) deacylase [Acidobacteria bacterium]|nr:D-tyrosyl-tRNA(Tyr) deacylase [Acidobacteriota bacterium]